MKITVLGGCWRRHASHSCDQKCLLPRNSEAYASEFWEIPKKCFHCTQKHTSIKMNTITTCYGKKNSLPSVWYSYTHSEES